MSRVRTFAMVRLLGSGAFGQVIGGPFSLGSDRLWSVRMLDGRALMVPEQRLVNVEDTE